MLRWSFCTWLLIICEFTLLLLSGDTSAADKTLSKIMKEELKNTKLPPCQLCRTLVDSFKKGMEKTAKSNFQGGDTAWEEEKRLVYARSEVRFVEILENLCSDVERGQSQCQSTAEDVEQHLENWWKGYQDSDLYHWLCIDTLKHCCPENHYGPNCLPCPGYPGHERAKTSNYTICSGNGKCKGNGTRKGNGECSCDEGYDGLLCHKCASTYYESYRDDTKLLCSKCHVACQRDCTQAGPKGCLECNTGWMFRGSGKGCIDINECVSDAGPCTKNEFCVNNEGSYTCLACDRACEGCTGDGPDMCDKCAKGFFMKDNLCIEGAGWDAGNIETTRYLTYFGLTIATYIIFQKNPVIASFIGVLVAMYIMVSEYMLDTSLMSSAHSFISAL